MADLLNLEDAAQLLNVTNDELVKFTEDGDIKGYRDGDDLKYKRADLEQFASDRGIAMVDSEMLDLLDGDDDDDEDTSDATVAGDPLGLDDDSFSLLDDDMEGDGEDSVLITKQDLNALEAATTEEPKDVSADSDEEPEDVSADSDGELELADEDSTITAPVADGGLLDDDMNFDMEDDSTVMATDGVSSLLDDDMNFDMEEDNTVMADGSANVEIGDADSNDDTQLGVVDNFGVTDGDLVLGGMDSSDVTLGAADSGITLESPSDSGILLDGEAIDLSDSEATQLELPGAAEGSDILIEGDKSFNLGTPDGSDEMSDSGSQVIAISDSVAVSLDDGGLEQVAGLDGLDSLDEVSPEESPIPAGIAPPVQELDYSAWIVMTLMMITLVLVLTGMMMADVVKTMWSWNEGTELSSSVIMDTIIEMFNMRPGP